MALLSLKLAFSTDGYLTQKSNRTIIYNIRENKKVNYQIEVRVYRLEDKGEDRPEEVDVYKTQLEISSKTDAVTDILKRVSNEVDVAILGDQALCNHPDVDYDKNNLPYCYECGMDLEPDYDLIAKYEGAE